MRIQIFLFLYCLLSVRTAWSQKFEAGLKAGIIASQVDGDQLGGFDKVGIVAGGFVNRKISGKMNLQFELEYIQKGSRQALNTDFMTYFLLRLNYMEVPLMVTYAAGKKWNLEAGISVATLVGSLEEDHYGEITGSPDFYKTDYLANGGGNYFITPHLLLNIRYSYSVATIRPKYENYSYFYSGKGQYNKILAFSMAYRF